MSDALAWGVERVVQDEDATLPAWLARVDYIGWNSDHQGRKRATPAEVNKAVVAAGGERGFVLDGRRRVLVFRGVNLRPEVDRGHRARAPHAADGAELTNEAIEAALRALYDAGLVRGRRTLDIAYLRLSGDPAAMLCRECGMVTRHQRTGLHVSCARRRRRRERRGERDVSQRRRR